MRSRVWRNILLGSYDDQQRLHRNAKNMPTSDEYDEIIRADITRTFANDEWFATHFTTLTDILRCYAYTNVGMGYMQGMSFPVFVLYRTFFTDAPKNAAVDTFYAFHRLINVVRPIYPLSDSDPVPAKFNDDICTLVILMVAVTDSDFAQTLRTYKHILTVMVFQCVPTLFANKFNYDETCIVFDFIFDTSNRTMFRNVLRILVATLFVFKPVFMYMHEHTIMELISVRDYHNVHKIITLAKNIEV